MNKSFKTLSGYCFILEDRILFAPSDNPKVFLDDPNLQKLQIRMIRVRGLLYPVIIFFTLLGFYLSIQDIIDGEIISSLFFLGLGIVLLRLLMVYLLSNPRLMIKKDKIISMKYRKEITWLGIWPMFIIKFEKENGKIGRKLIVLKYTLSDYGKEIADHAIFLFSEEGLLK